MPGVFFILVGSADDDYSIWCDMDEHTHVVERRGPRGYLFNTYDPVLLVKFTLQNEITYMIKMIKIP